jgi:L-asparaginase/Glu-tRNA(Gln) amidotransferase subunit D
MDQMPAAKPKNISRYELRMANLLYLLLLLMTCITAMAQKLPRVALLSTGGTIASKQDPVKGGYVPALFGEDLGLGRACDKEGRGDRSRAIL